jgi:hypothetical protein
MNACRFASFNTNDLVYYLTRAGANVNKVTTHNFNAAHDCADYSSSTSAMQHLINYGVNLDL